MLKFLERHAGSIQGTLGCFDRILIQGTLRYIGNSYEITKYFRCRKIMFKQFQEWAKPYSESIRADVEVVADAAGVEIQVIRKSRSVRKEDLIEAILKTRGRHPGVVHILSTMEACTTYQPWHNKKTHENYLRPCSGKCTHFYIYFIDEELGLCHLRIPTWAPFKLQVGSFTHYRTVDHRDGTQSFTKAPVCKTIYSLPDLTRIMAACNRRYLEFIGAVDDPTNEIQAVQRISRRVRKNDRTYRGFNLFEEEDLAAIRAISQGQHVGFGFRNKSLRDKLPGKSCAQIGRIIKRLRMHGLVKKAARSFKYHLTALGKRVAATALKLKEMFVIPSLRGHLAST